MRQEDEFEKLENDAELDSFVMDKCSKKKTKKSFKKCLLRAILEFNDYFEYFYAHIGDNESQKLKQLNGDKF